MGVVFGATNVPLAMQSALDDAKSLRRAVQGIGTDEATIIAIVGTRTRYQLLQIQEAYRNEFKSDCVKDIKDDCSGGFGEAIVSLMAPLLTVKTEYLYRSMQGVATKDKALIDVFAFCSTQEIQNMSELYKETYGKELEGVLNEETSGNFRKTLITLLKCVRIPETDPVDEAKAKNDAIHLYDSGEKRFGTDDESFINLITSSSQRHLAAVSAFYKDLYGKTLIEAIQKETSGDYRDLLKALATPRIEWYAERLHTAVRGLGTHDTRLIYIMTITEPDERQQVADYYGSKYKESLDDALKGDLSGDYLNLMLALLTKRN